MYALLIRFLLFISALFIFKRMIGLFVSGNSGKPKKEAAGSGASTIKDTVKDPICGMYMDPRLAIHLENGRGSFYFCSEECRHKFLSAPPAKEPL
jgi:YHS domain-containing protein